jgi:hypothetical protein
MSRRASDPDTAEWMDDIAAGLAAAGLAVQVHDTCGVLDLAGRSELAGGKPVEVIVDEDGYTQVSYWNPPGAAPAQITATLAAVLAAIGGAPAAQSALLAHRI